MQVQEAYLKLSDPVKRREYDSIDEFDDSLPLECASADFFKVPLQRDLCLQISHLLDFVFLSQFWDEPA